MLGRHPIWRNSGSEVLFSPILNWGLGGFVRSALTISAVAHALLLGSHRIARPGPACKAGQKSILCRVEIVSPDEVGEATKAQVPAKADIRAEFDEPDATEFQTLPRRRSGRITLSSTSKCRGRHRRRLRRRPRRPKSKSRAIPQLWPAGSTRRSVRRLWPQAIRPGRARGKSLAKGHRDVQGAPARMLESAGRPRGRPASRGGVARIIDAERSTHGGAHVACGQCIAGRAGADGNGHACVASMPALRLSACHKT